MQKLLCLCSCWGVGRFRHGRLCTWFTQGSLRSRAGPEESWRWDPVPVSKARSPAPSVPWGRVLEMNPCWLGTPETTYLPTWGLSAASRCVCPGWWDTRTPRFLDQSSTEREECPVRKEAWRTHHETPRSPTLPASQAEGAGVLDGGGDRRVPQRQVDRSSCQACW